MLGHFTAELPGLVENVSFIAAKMTAEEARPGVPVDSGRAARSISAYMTGGQAMTVGGEDVDYYAWLEYGGLSGKHGSNRRASVAEGRYIYPAYQRTEPAIQRMMENQLAELVSSIFG